MVSPEFVAPVWASGVRQDAAGKDFAKEPIIGVDSQPAGTWDFLVPPTAKPGDIIEVRKGPGKDWAYFEVRDVDPGQHPTISLAPLAKEDLPKNCSLLVTLAKSNPFRPRGRRRW